MIAASGGNAIDFSAAASAEPPAFEIRKLKICEARDCGRTFLRLSGSRRVICDRCHAKEHARRAAAWQATKTIQRYQRGI
jgi:hypothetical protein